MVAHFSTADVARAQAYLSNVKTDMVPLAQSHANVAIINGI